MAWTPVWHQAISGALMKGKLVGKKKTVCFHFESNHASNAMRFCFSNRNADYPYEVGEMAVWVKGKAYPVTLNGDKTFTIQPGGRTYSDAIAVPVQEKGIVEVRIFYKSFILDTNMIEESTTRHRGNAVNRTVLPKGERNLVERILKANCGVPMIESIEVDVEEPSHMILAFGDSITAMGRWVRPLTKRLYEAYGNKYALLNSGISGNCWLTVQENPFAAVYGKKGMERAAWDVFDQEHLHTVIFGLGVNDLACLKADNKDLICFEKFTQTVAEFAEKLHARNVRVVMQTITPRCGCSLGEFTEEMEALRCRINDWIRECGLFDYVFDADVLMHNPEKPNYFDDRYHQGDYLHPNEEGGQLLAERFDLSQLTGETVK